MYGALHEAAGVRGPAAWVVLVSGAVTARITMALAGLLAGTLLNTAAASTQGDAGPSGPAADAGPLEKEANSDEDPGTSGAGAVAEEEEDPDEGATAVSLGAAASEELSVTVQDVLMVAVPEMGIRVVDLADPANPEVLAVLAPGAEVTGLHMVSSTLVAVLADYSVLTWDVSDPRMPVMLGGDSTGGGDGQQGDSWGQFEDVVSIEGTVLSVEHGWVVIDVGQEQGVVPGMRFEVLTEYKKGKGIVTIHSVEDETASGPLPYRATAREGDEVVSTCKTWAAKKWMFDGSGGESHTQISLHMAPILGTGRGRDSWGFIGSFQVSHVFEKPAKLSFLLAPVALGHSSSGVGAVFEFGAMAGLSTRYVELMLGAGGHLSAVLEDNHALILNSIRLGAIHSFHMKFLFTWIIPAPTKFLPTTTTFTVDVPVAPRLNLYAQIGGGNLTHYLGNDGTGWASFLLGARLFIRGTGGPGTVILSTAFGHGYAWDQRCEDDAGNDIACVGGSTWGPLVSMGLDWRF